MRTPVFLAALLLVVGMSAAQPAAAERSLTPAASWNVGSGVAAPAGQYRDRRSDYRHGRYSRRPHYRAYHYRGRDRYRRGRVVCRTAWHHRRPYRRCWRTR